VEPVEGLALVAQQAAASGSAAEKQREIEAAEQALGFLEQSQ